MKAYWAIGGFRGEASLDTRLRRITVNTFLNHQREMKTVYSSGKKAFRNLADFVRIVLVIPDVPQLIAGAQTDVAPATDKDALPKVQDAIASGHFERR